MASEVLKGQVTDISLNFSVYFWQKFLQVLTFDRRKITPNQKNTSVEMHNLEFDM